MHILIVNPHLTTHHTEAGAWARQLVADLRATGTVVATIPNFSGDETRHPTKRRRHRRILKRWLPNRIVLYLNEVSVAKAALGNLARGAWIAWREHRRHGPGVVYARTYQYDWTPCVIAAILKRPLVLEVHSPFYLERRLRGLRESKLIRRLDHAQWNRATIIRVVSKPMVKVLADEGVASKLVRYIPYGVDIIDRNPRTSTAAKHRVEVVFVGSLYRWHDLESLIDAFAAARRQVENLHLTVIGDGTTRLACEAKARQLSLDNEIEFVGWLPKDEVAKRLTRADIAVAPYRRLEPFFYDPAKILEYMSAGLAIIATNLPRIAEMLDFGRAGVLVPPGDVEAMTKSLVLLASDGALRRQLGDAAQKLIKQDYARKKVAERIVSLCNEAAAAG